MKALLQEESEKMTIEEEIESQVNLADVNITFESIHSYKCLR